MGASSSTSLWLAHLSSLVHSYMRSAFELGVKIILCEFEPKALDFGLVRFGRQAMLVYASWKINER